jgi:hypothetical protein
VERLARSHPNALAELLGHSILFEGALQDDTPFIIRSDRSGEVRFDDDNGDDLLEADERGDEDVLATPSAF